MTASAPSRPWSKIRDAFPLNMAAAQGNILEATASGDFWLAGFSPVYTSCGPYSMEAWVSDRPFALGTAADHFYPIVSHLGAQAVADELGLVVPTSKLEDAAQAQAAVSLDVDSMILNPKRADGSVGSDLWRPITSSRFAAEEESKRLDALIDGRPGLVGTIGKIWVSSTRLLNPGALKYGKKSGINYAFYTLTPQTTPPTPGPRPPSTPIGPWNVYQQEGAAHDLSHTDYSQRLRLVQPAVRVMGGQFGDHGVVMSIHDVGTSPELACLVHHTAVPMAVRHPWLPEGSCFGDPNGESCGPPFGNPPANPPPPPPNPTDARRYDVGRLAPLVGIVLIGAAWYWS